MNEDRIAQAEQSIRKLLGVSNLQDKRFLGIGSGSGLFSLPRRRLGAVVQSFDYDPKSVGCTQELKARYFGGDSQWLIEEGSVLDRHYLGRLRQFDVGYSSGVLDYTDACDRLWKMWLPWLPVAASSSSRLRTIRPLEPTVAHLEAHLQRPTTACRNPYGLAVMGRAS